MTVESSTCWNTKKPGCLSLTWHTSIYRIVSGEPYYKIRNQRGNSSLQNLDAGYPEKKWRHDIKTSYGKILPRHTETCVQAPPPPPPPPLSAFDHSIQKASERQSLTTIARRQQQKHHNPTTTSPPLPPNHNHNTTTPSPAPPPV